MFIWKKVKKVKNVKKVKKVKDKNAPKPRLTAIALATPIQSWVSARPILERFKYATRIPIINAASNPSRRAIRKVLAIGKIYPRDGYFRNFSVA